MTEYEITHRSAWLDTVADLLGFRKGLPSGLKRIAECLYDQAQAPRDAVRKLKEYIGHDLAR